jgi:polyhydroxyalkanoate synthesis regulator phasin
MGGSAIALAIAMGLQTFVFGQSDMQRLKEDVSALSERVTKLEAPHSNE